ncbi:MAG: hypothetical protein ABMA26_24085 [Limisphaerales bacterium]
MAEQQTVTRRAVMPVVVTLSITSAVLALLVAICAQVEFERFESKAEYWPSLTVNTKAVPFLGVVLVLLTFGFGTQLVRNTECRLTTLLWYCSAVILAHLLWLAVSFVSVYILYFKFFQWL